MHETGLFVITLYLLFGATIAGFLIYLKRRAATILRRLRRKEIYNKKDTIEWY